MRTLVIVGHPNPDSFGSALAQRYAEAARNLGAEVEVLSLSELDFDLSLRGGFQGEQALEPDLMRAQELLKWCTHLCVVFPVWWGAPPALLKGFFDRTLLPGFAFKFRPSGLSEKLLAGRSARMIVTSDSPGWYLRWIMGDSAVNAVRRSTLAFCGFKVRLTRLNSVRTSSPEQRDRWMNAVGRAAGQDHRGPTVPLPQTA